MPEGKINIKKNPVETFNPKQEIKKSTVKSKWPDVSIKNKNQEDKKSRTEINKNVNKQVLKNGTQAQKSGALQGLEQVSSQSETSMFTASQSEVSDFVISSDENIDIEEENIVVFVNNEYAFQNSTDFSKSDSYKKDKRNPNESESDKKQDKELLKNSRERRSIDRSRLRENDPSSRRCFQNSLNRYSSGYYSSNRSHCSNRNRYTSDRTRCIRSWDKSRNHRYSRSPPNTSERTRRRSRSRNHSRGRRRSRSGSKGRNRSQSSDSLKLENKNLLIKRRKMSDSPIRLIQKPLECKKWLQNHRNSSEVEKQPSPSPPLLPAVSLPPQLTPPVQNSVNYQPQIKLNNVSNPEFSSQPVISRNTQNLDAFPNLSITPYVNVKNTPYIPSLLNLPVYITPTRNKVTHDVDGRPIPITPDGRSLPINLSGRLFPHVLCPINNTPLPIFLDEDGVIKLPNGEPVARAFPNQLPVNIDGNVIPVGPDSRPLYPCPNIPRQNPFITSQVKNQCIPGILPVSADQRFQINQTDLRLSEVSVTHTNLTVINQIKPTKLSPTVKHIKTMPDLKIQESINTPKVTEDQTKPDSSKQSQEKEPEVSEKPKPEAFKLQTTSKVSDKVTEACIKKEKKNFEDVDLTKIIVKLLEKIQKINVREIYLKKIRGEFKKKILNKKTEANKTLRPLNESEKDSMPESDEKHSRTKPDEDISEENELSPEEVLLEKKFVETLKEAITLLAEINFNNVRSGRFLFSDSPISLIIQNSPNESPLLRDTTLLPFLSPESFQPSKKNDMVKFCFQFSKNPAKGKSSATSSSLAVQCDFTTERIETMESKIVKLKRQLFHCQNKNFELTETCKSLTEENKKKTEELNNTIRQLDQKNKIIKDLIQRSSLI